MTQLVMEPDSSEEEQKAKGKKGKKEKKVAVKKEAKEPTLEGVLVTAASKDLLAQEPMKAFMLRAQHRLRAYIAQVNTWPRKQGNSIEKREVPEEMLEKTRKKHKTYQTEQFWALYQELWDNLKMRDAMVRRVSIHNSSSPSTIDACIYPGLQGSGSASPRGEAEGKARRRQGVPLHQGLQRRL